MNLGLAVLIFFLVFMQGSPRGLTIITQVSPGSPAAQVGLLSGDRIVAVDGRRVRYFDDLETLVQQHLGQRVTIEIQRGSRDFSTTLVPRRTPPKNQGPIGVVLDRTATVAYSPGNALQQSLNEVGLMVTSIPQVINTVSHHGGNGVAGPIGIAHLTTTVVHNEPKQGFGSLLEFMALLSANLGVLNLLPIPALDGGRIVFVLISWIRRRNLDPEVEGLIHMMGMAALLVLIVVVSYHDIVGWLTGSSF
jgi:regulator of sigma E protease